MNIHQYSLYVYCYFMYATIHKLSLNDKLAKFITSLGLRKDQGTQVNSSIYYVSLISIYLT